jgi:hypothetical protein
VVFHNLQIWVSLENRKTFGLMNWAQPSGTVARVGFKLITPHASPTGIGEWVLHRDPIGPASRRPSNADMQDHARPSLSPSPIKGDSGQRFSPFAISFPSTEVRTLLRSLPASRHLAPPLGDSSLIASLHFLAPLLP